MMRQPSCPPWCTREHPDQAVYLAHSGVVAERQADDGAIVQVRAAWSQRLDGKPSMTPHIQLRRCAGADRTAVDLTAVEALTLAVVLETTHADGWLSGHLSDAARTILGDDAEEGEAES